MIVKSADFVTSAVKPSQYPEALHPEAAFAGRSNVGKSSLINTLVNRKRLVKTSATPGRTQLINFFTVNDRLSLVDLPGYGYAKVPASVRRKWGPMIETYLKGRETLKAVVLIMDVRRIPGIEEQNFIDWLELLPQITHFGADQGGQALQIRSKKTTTGHRQRGRCRRSLADPFFRQDTAGKTGGLVGHRKGRF